MDGLLELAPLRLRSEPPRLGDLIARPRSDYDLQDEPILLPDEATLKPAAVLVPIVDRPDEATVLLTVRSAALKSHSAQIAFPGGRMDEDDDGPIATALREAEEEIGLPSGFVEPLGFLDAYITARATASCRSWRGSGPASRSRSTRMRSMKPSRRRSRS